MEYYRLVVDFAHEELGEEFETLISKVSDAIQDVLDPDHPGEPCKRDWGMKGGSVTAEYEVYHEVIADQYVKMFKNKLNETESVDEFLKEVTPDE